jgi:hypothetical protein
MVRSAHPTLTDRSHDLDEVNELDILIMQRRMQEINDAYYVLINKKLSK